jgi:hypothetical protein
MLARGAATGVVSGLAAAAVTGAGGLTGFGASAAVLTSWRGAAAGAGAGGGGVAAIGASAAVFTSCRGGAAGVAVSAHPATVGARAAATGA